MAITNLLEDGFYGTGDLYYKAADIWRSNVIGGAVATIGGGALWGAMEAMPDAPLTARLITGIVGLAGIASISYGAGRLHEISDEYSALQTTGGSTVHQA